MTSDTEAAHPSPAATGGFDALGVPVVLLKALAVMGATVPTRVQREAIPPAIEGSDIAVVAATGTGKTLAYLLPVAARLLAEPPLRKRGRPVDPRRRTRALVLCPTRELAQQVASDAERLFRGTVLRAGAVYGKSALAPQREMVEHGVDLLVGTPGRVKELCELDSVSLAFVKQVVLDEADRMLDMGFLPQAKEILSRAPESRQLLLFTATMPRPIEAIIEEMLRAPVRVDLTGRAPGVVEGTPAPRTDKGQHLIDVADDDKAALTVALVKDGARAGVIVFCRTRRRAGWVAAALRRHQIRTAVIHGDRSQRQRQEALAGFAAGRSDVLVATDVASRGLHVAAVRTVINYDVPLLPEEYVHRVGRAGHGGGSHEAFTFRAPTDRERWVQVVRTTKNPLDSERAPDFSAYGRVRVGFAPDAERLVGGRPDGSHASIARVATGTRGSTGDEKSKRGKRDARGGRDSRDARDAGGTRGAGGTGGTAAARDARDPRDARKARAASAGGGAGQSAARRATGKSGGKKSGAGSRQADARPAGARPTGARPTGARQAAARPAGAPGARGARDAGTTGSRTPQHREGAPSVAALIRMGNAAAMRATGKKKKRRSPNASLSMRGSDRARAIEKGQRPGGGVRRAGA